MSIWLIEQRLWTVLLDDRTEQSQLIEQNAVGYRTKNQYRVGLPDGLGYKLLLTYLSTEYLPTASSMVPVAYWSTG